MTPGTTVFATFALLAALACGRAPIASVPVPEPEPEPAPVLAVLSTDRMSYIAEDASVGDFPRFEFTLIAELENLTDQPLLVERCRGDDPHPLVTVQLKGSDDLLGAAYHQVMGCAGNFSPIVVDPRSSRVDTLLLSGPNAFRRTGEFEGALEGEFQLLYGVCTEFRVGACPFPTEPARSNFFEVRLAE